ncbi:ATP-binding cassette domain-containing protein [Mesorhizobium sp.]|uniref:phosphonate ABC transporter ATP-binding protein n=1 Tax=Mesorhizobium sp. TaxID=1871066 RepID=UPI000FE8F6E2|nr:ATP-binding cassette domain-containing protein [Mesorhizobium sp.]RWM61564.1 MAG: ATP-binding cassette domain-containing protein [Mesorhizobium sp.]RWN02952.1 MAG: ATP-binding cassette domain-containing protein [Mesorhizobium sp.]TIO71338.1 MAG: ATP-binding cassette domain-containing protein [Mesorhizobium sp.]TIR42330.1 MAG: ATP-binding cassette domain-containing protein [Mesorhizobium sp.]
MTAIIRAHDLAKSYANGKVIFSNIGLNVASRERVALIGSNGAGKSTLLKCLIGLLPSSSGEVVTLGETFRSAPSAAQLRRIRRQIGFVFQHHGLVSRQSVLTNVLQGKLGLPGGWRGWHHSIAKQHWREEAMQALADVRLLGKAGARADALSGGQAQRVAIARALVRRPQLLIADEPAASLDPAAGHDVMRVFSELTQEHAITLVYTTHDMEHALDYSDRMIALKAGKVFFDRPTAQVTRADLKDVFDA